MPAAVTPPPTDDLDTRRRPGTMGLLLIAPMLVWLVALVVVPAAIMVVYSFSERNPDTGQATFVFTLQNYVDLFRPPYVKAFSLALGTGGVAAAVIVLAIRYLGRQWMWLAELLGKVQGRIGAATFLACFWIAINVFADSSGEGGRLLKIIVDSINYAGLSTIICVLIGYPAAYFIGRSPESVRNLLLILVMIPFWTSFLVRTYAWITILSDNGLFNATLQWMGVIGEPIMLKDTPTAVMIGLVYTYLPFMILPIYGSVERLDNAMVEAALDLGAGPLRAFWGVILPLTQPGIIAGVLLVFIPAIGMFAVNDILGGHNVQMIGNEIQQLTTRARNMPLGAALGTVLLLIFVLIYYFGTRRRATA